MHVSITQIMNYKNKYKILYILQNLLFFYFILFYFIFFLNYRQTKVKYKIIK